MVRFSDEQSLEHGVTEGWLERIVGQCLSYENIDYGCEVGVTFVDDDAIRTLNREHRKLDRKTDVLSFPMLSDVRSVEKTDIDPETGLVYLGDVVISLETAVKQAEMFGHSLEREVGDAGSTEEASFTIVLREVLAFLFAFKRALDLLGFFFPAMQKMLKGASVWRKMR